MQDITVRRMKALDDFKLDLTFSDGKRKVYDMKPQIWGPAFEPMKGNMDFFRQAFLRMGTVAWPENIDIAPEELYENGVDYRISNRNHCVIH
ncbi:MAG: DUF2442 domain-containing protein [Kiritimatiellaeota bacterium]|nr:DUF2442 domain-containing protein [Kiritimatiellota bacterium]